MAFYLETQTHMSTCIFSSIRAEFERAFGCFDANGDGKISPPELQLLMRSVGRELSLEDARHMVESSDSDADGLLEMDEFIGLVAGEQEGSEGCVAAKSLKRPMLSRLGSFGGVEECKLRFVGLKLAKRE